MKERDEGMGGMDGSEGVDASNENGKQKPMMEFGEEAELFSLLIASRNICFPS